jgi:choice-of-anchor A domain-containing protein
MKKIVIAIMLGTGFFLSNQAHASFLGTAGEFNAFIFNDLTYQGSDIEGRIAVGNNAVAPLSVGNKWKEQYGKNDDVLFAKNKVEANGRIYGNIVVGTKSEVSSTTYDGTRTDFSNQIDFLKEKTYLENLSRSLGKIAANETAKNQSNFLELSAASRDNLHVYDISTSDFIGWGMGFLNADMNAFGNDTFILNIRGTDAVSFSGSMGWFSKGLGSYYTNDLDNVQNRILFNFIDATEITIGNIAFDGSILAPNAHIFASGGNVDGTVIAKSISGVTELHHKPFEGTVPGTVPVPGAVWLLGFGVMGLAAFRKKNPTA